jgi:tetratricopeptide (TPR) repeat protein
VAQLSAAHRRDPFACFAAGWIALRRGEGAAAEAAYRDVLRAWPEDDRALDDLGTALTQQGRHKEAVGAYERAVRANPKNAIALFNLAQAYLVGFDFDQANHALARASSLDFDGVREYKNQPARNGALDPVPDWISPGRQWQALREPWAAGPRALPPQWLDRTEWSAKHFTWIVIVVGVLAILLGQRLNKGLPLHRCVNCDRVVCRRCAERRRAQAVCHNCARVARGAASTTFARILLARERERSTRVLRGARLMASFAVPGAGLILYRRVWRALILILLTAFVVTVPLGGAWPYVARARVGFAFDPWHLDTVVPLALIYALSIWGYLLEQRRIAARLAAEMRPARSRPRVSTRVQDEGHTEEAA